MLGLKIQDQDCDFNLDDRTLSRILLEPNEKEDVFYTYEYAQKIIDMQFPMTEKYFIILFNVYLFGFFIPFNLYIIGPYYHRTPDNDEYTYGLYS